MKHKKISIKWKIFSYLLGFTAILLVILWFLQIVYLGTFYRIIKMSKAESAEAQVISLLKNVSDDLSDQIDEIAAQNNLAIYITDTQGNEIYNAEYIATTRMSSLPEEEFQRYYKAAEENGGSIKIEYEGNHNKTFGDNIVPPDGFQEQNTESAGETVSGMPEMPGNVPDDNFIQNHGQSMVESVIFVSIIDGNGMDYVVMINSQLTPVDATVETLKIQMVWISVIMIGLSLGIALLISRRISGSMIKVSNSAKELAKGNYNVTFDGNDFKEIADLSDTLNYATKELEKTENLRRELIANVSHDLRTPLTMITAYSEVMRDLPGENTPENVQVVIDEAKRLTNLVNDMLDLSKLQSGVLELKKTPYNLTKSIRSVLERYNKLVEQDGYTITFKYQEEVVIEADEYKIYQVIYNLVNNAVNYTGPDKKITVRQKLKSDCVRIEVTDDGEGIEKESLPYIWDRYYKVDKTHKRAVMGTGLGLSIVKNILEAHHARYGADSEAGEGSTFWFELKL